MFNPTTKTELDISGQRFRFAPHPAVPSMVWGQEGRHATVYRIESTGNGRGSYALKVFRPVFRHAGLIEAAEALALYEDLPGMDVCRQTVLTEETHPALIDQHEDLSYAMLMPWIEGETWFDTLNGKAHMTIDQARAVAEHTAWVLYTLEYNHLAHCDLSSGNLIVDPTGIQVQLIDVEDLYSPWLDPPPYLPAGSMGYQHRDAADRGQWGPLGDRFAGAVLMAEMLGWAHPEIREAAWGESYFDPTELQDQDSERYHLLVDTIRAYDPGFVETFEQAWRSTDLDACPPIEIWYNLFDSLPRDPVAEWAPIEAAGFTTEEPTPEPASAPGWKQAQPPTAPQPASTPGPAQAQQPAQPKQGGGQQPQQQSTGDKIKQGCRTGCLTLFVITFLLAACGLNVWLFNLWELF